MRAPPRPPPRRAAPRPGLWAAALVGSAALHAAALAALVIWTGREAADEPGIPQGVALVFEDTAARAGAPDEGPPGTPRRSEPRLAETSPEPVPAPAEAPAEPAPALAEAAAPPADPAPLPPAPSLPPSGPVVPAPPGTVAPPPAPAEVPAQGPPAEIAELPLPPPPEPPPPPPPESLAALAPPPPPAAHPPPRPAAPPPRAARPAEEAVRLNAGSAALPDPSLGARALGAVTPPSAAPGERNAPPAYPAESRRRGEEGVVRLALRIGSDGRVDSAEVALSSGFEALDRAALEAVRRWRFRPAMQGGLPVPGTLTTAVHFRLTQAERR